jgi:hypothetical protein
MIVFIISGIDVLCYYFLFLIYSTLQILVLLTHDRKSNTTPIKKLDGRPQIQIQISDTAPVSLSLWR